MQLIENSFTRELTQLLSKYNKTIIADKGGIYIVHDVSKKQIVLGIPDTPGDGQYDKVFFIKK